MIPQSSGSTTDITHRPHESFHTALRGPGVVTHGPIMIGINNVKLMK
jgi:hypothetical protein